MPFFYRNAGKVYCQTCLVMALLEKICQLNLVHNHLVAVPDREQKGYTVTTLSTSNSGFCFVV